MRLSLFLGLLITITAAAGSFKLFSDTLNLSVGTYRYIKFRVTPEQAVDARITGSFTTDPGETDMEFILLTELNYLSGWQNRGEIDTLAVHRGKADSISIPVPDFGDFVLIVSNRGNRVPVEFSADLRLSFTGSGITYDSLPMGMTVLVTILAAGLVTAAIILTVKKLG